MSFLESLPPNGVLFPLAISSREVYPNRAYPTFTLGEHTAVPVCVLYCDRMPDRSYPLGNVYSFLVGQVIAGEGEEEDRRRDAGRYLRDVLLRDTRTTRLRRLMRKARLHEKFPVPEILRKVKDKEWLNYLCTAPSLYWGFDVYEGSHLLTVGRLWDVIADTNDEAMERLAEEV